LLLRPLFFFRALFVFFIATSRIENIFSLGIELSFYCTVIFRGLYCFSLLFRLISFYFTAFLQSWAYVLWAAKQNRSGAVNENGPTIIELEITQPSLASFFGFTLGQPKFMQKSPRQPCD